MTSDTARQAAYRDFWERFVPYVERMGEDWIGSRKATPERGHLIAHPAPAVKLWSSFIRNECIRVDAYIQTNDESENRRRFGALAEHRDEFGALFSGELEWDETTSGSGCRLAVVTGGSVDRVDEHDKYMAWFYATSKQFVQAQPMWDVLSRVDEEAPAGPGDLMIWIGDDGVPRIQTEQ